MADVIEARVKQKKDTLANWEANPMIILDGEQAFVVGDSGQPINFKIGDGTKRFSELPFWIQYDQAAYIDYEATPTQPIAYTFVGEGTYGAITVAEGYMAVLGWNGTSWSKNAEIELPTVDTSDLVMNDELGYKETVIDVTVNRKVGVGLSSGGIEVTSAGYIIASKVQVKPSSTYVLSNLVPVTNAKFIVQMKSTGEVIFVTPVTSSIMNINTDALCTQLSYTIKAPSEATETTPVLKWIDDTKISKIKNAQIIDINAQSILDKLKLNKQYSKGFILPATALNSGGINVSGAGYAIINKIPVKGNANYIIGGVRDSVNGSKYISQYNNLGVHISTVELKDLPKLITTNANTRFISYTIETPAETDGYGTANNYIGEVNIFANDVLLSVLNGKKCVIFSNSIWWYDRRNFLATHKESGQIVVALPSYIRRDLGMTIDNQAESGWDITQVYTSRILTYTGYADTSLVILEEIANSARKGIPLGTVQAIGSTFNTSTHAGAFQASIEHILSQNPNIKIHLVVGYNGFFKESGTTNVPSTSLGPEMVIPRAYVDNIIALGKLYSLKVTNLYDNAGVNKLNKDILMGDNPDQPYQLHPTNELYKMAAPLLINDLRKY